MTEPREKKKPRRKKSKPAVDNPPSSQAAETETRDPHFSDAFPPNAALSALVAAFEAGDYGRVRREAPLLAKKTDDEAVRKAAEQLRRRIDPEPVTSYLLIAAIALLAFLSIWYWTNPHAH